MVHGRAIPFPEVRPPRQSVCALVMHQVRLPLPAERSTSASRRVSLKRRACWRWSSTPTVNYPNRNVIINQAVNLISTTPNILKCPRLTHEFYFILYFLIEAYSMKRSRQLLFFKYLISDTLEICNCLLHIPILEFERCSKPLLGETSPPISQFRTPHIRVTILVRSDSRNRQQIIKHFSSRQVGFSCNFRRNSVSPPQSKKALFQNEPQMIPIVLFDFVWVRLIIINFPSVLLVAEPN